MSEQVYREAYVAGLTPDPDLNVSQWADEYRFLSQKASAEPGRWRTDRTPYLREIMDCLSPHSPIQRVVFQAGAQVGKALAVDTPISTPSGWSLMGDLNAGDQVFDADGNPTTIIGVSEVFYDHDCFEVEFSDHTVITADADHLWVVDDCPGKVLGEKTLTTRYIAETFRAGGRNRYAIPVAKPLSLPERTLPIDPYVLGVWLGDGNSKAAQITGHKDDVEIAEHIRSSGHVVHVRKIDVRSENVINMHIDPKGVRAQFCIRGHDTHRHGRTKRGNCVECGRQRSRGHGIDPILPRKKRLGELLADNGLVGNKHIPKEYIRASFNQRLALMQGLMDTDGYIGYNGRSEFCSASERLANDFMDLAWSLGLKPSLYRSKSASAWRVSFIAYSNLPIFRLKRKLDALPSRDGRRTSETERRRIIDVRRVPSVPTRCILVDNPRHLFLAGREMVPTHNTETGNNWTGYVIDMAPGPMMLVQPTVDTAKRLSKQRLAPMIEETPRLKARIADSRSRDSGNTMMVKEFPGGVMVVTGANSAVGLRSMPVRYLFLDEVDGYPADLDGEGDPVQLAERRTTTFARRKVFMCSTPTVKEHSRIEREYLASDQRRFFIPCPHCGEFQWLKWAQLKWDDGDPTTAHYVCEHNGCVIEEHNKTDFLLKGEWRPTATGDGRTAGFHLSSLYSPLGWKSWAEIAAEFIAAKGDPPLLKTWVNTILGETWEDEIAAKIGAGELQERVEFYQPGIAPEGVLAVTCGVDVQDNRLAVSIIGWGRDEESWVISHQEIFGDPSKPEIWGQLTNVITTPVEHELFEPMPILSTCIDSGGHFTHEVYAFAREHRAHNVMAVKGQSQKNKPIIGRPTKVDLNIKRHTLKNGAEVWPVGSDTAKSTIYARLKLNEPGPGFTHFHAELEPDYFNQLTAERLQTRYLRGFPVREWVKKPGARNEALDTFVYSLAAMQALYMRFNRKTIWDQLEKRAVPKQVKAEAPQVLPKQAPKRNVSRPSSFVTNW